MKKSVLTVFTIVLTVISLVGCGNSNNETSTDDSNGESFGYSYGYSINFSDKEIEEGSLNFISEGTSYSWDYDQN